MTNEEKRQKDKKELEYLYLELSPLVHQRTIFQKIKRLLCELWENL